MEYVVHIMLAIVVFGFDRHIFIADLADFHIFTCSRLFEQENRWYKKIIVVE